MLADGPGVPITPVATAGVAAGSVGSNGTHQAGLDELPHSAGVPMAGAPACSMSGVSAVVATTAGAAVAPEVYDAPALYDTHTPVHVMGGMLDDTPRPAADRQVTGKGPGAGPVTHHATLVDDENLYRKSHSRMAPPGSSAGTQPVAPEPDWHTQRVASDEYGNGSDAAGLEDDFGHDEVPPLQPGSLLEGWHVGDRYDLQQLLGRGAYGEVAMAYDTVTKTKVAIKRIIGVFSNVTDAHRILREIYILRNLRHKNVIQLVDIPLPPSYDDFHDLYLVFEFVDTDLYKLILSKQFLSTEHIQTFLYQLLCGLKYVHSAQVIHRDMKPANILLNEDCSLRICDFGLSRILTVAEPPPPPGRTSHSFRRASRAGLKRTRSLSVGVGAGRLARSSSVPAEARRERFESCDVRRGMPVPAKSPPRQIQRQLTKHVVTRWYRPPELILLQEYTFPVDMWSVGCIFAELLSMQQESVPNFGDRQPLFPGKSCFPLSAESPSSYADRLDQLNVIFDVIGTPSAEDLEHVQGDVRLYLEKLSPKPPSDLSKRFRGADALGLDLLRKLLVFHPAKRITVEQCLNHPFLASVRDPRVEYNAAKPLPLEVTNENGLDEATLKHKIYQEIILFRRGCGAGAPAGRVKARGTTGNATKRPSAHAENGAGAGGAGAGAGAGAGVAQTSSAADTAAPSTVSRVKRRRTSSASDVKDSAPGLSRGRSV